MRVSVGSVPAGEQATGEKRWTDAYPGEAANVALGLEKDPKAVEKRFASMFTAARSSA